MTVSAPATTQHTIVRAVPTAPPPKPLATGRVARRLVTAQGAACRDIAADLEAAEAMGVGAHVDRRRDEQIGQALRLVRLARRDRVNVDAYLVLADGHLCEAIRLDRIKDEHDQRAEGQVAASIEAGRTVVAVHEHLLTGRTP